MDLPSKNMYDAFKDDIWKELGPLDPDWFQVLTAQTSTCEENVSDPDDLCPNQEGHFKTPLDKAALDSQLFSTPKVFRRSRVVSPETTEGEQSFTLEQEKETLPWTEADGSPHLFRVTKESVPGAKYGGMRPQNLETFDMLHTPSKSPVSYAKQISESLGAQIHPDISWTSSLNTPPAVPSTLILSKTDESPFPMSVSEDKTVFVRKLFPSLSNGAGVAATSPQNTGLPFHRGVVSPEAAQSPESRGSPQESLNPSPSAWRQKLPDAIEDGDLRSAVASVLDGAENVLSIFFSNSSSALRKVKTDRVKRKQIIATKEHGCSFADISTADNAAAAPSGQRTEELEPVELSSPPQLKTRDVGITQWSPLSLSEIPPFTDSSCHATQVENNILTERPQSDSVSGQLVRPPLTGTFSGFTKRKRKFVYTVDTSRIQGKETQSLKTDSSSQIPDSGYKVSAEPLGKAPDEAACSSVGQNEKPKQENVTEENRPLAVQPNVQDLDMSQLCRDFAHDFSQTSDLGKLSEVAKDNPRNGFSPSVCLSAMKQAKQKARHVTLPPDCDGVGVRTRPVSATNQNYSINEGTVSDSGFQSGVADITHPTPASFILPSSENIGQSQQWSTTDTHRAASSLATNTRNHGKIYSDEMLQEAETDAKLPGAVKESRTLGPTEHTESTSTQPPIGAKGTVNSTNCFPSECQVNDSLPERTTVSLPSVRASGFKTASNKTIQVSSADLEKAKRLLEDNEPERSFCDQPTKRAPDTKLEISMSNATGENTISNSNQPPSSSEHGDVSCQLTVSQKADVTELCTLLEEADSQFEFTQFKTAKLQQHRQDNAPSPRKVDKELDPDFLMGIDFDDSFDDRRSDAEKNLVTTVTLDGTTSVADRKTNCETSKVTSKSSMKKENASIEDAPSSSKCISEGSRTIMSAEPPNIDRAGRSETTKQENRSALMLGGGFKTARGNLLRVSKDCLSKARALFADLEDNLTEQKSAGEQSGDAAAETEQRRVASIKDNNAAKSFKSGKMDRTSFQSAGGISISAKAMKAADALFKDCDIGDNNTGVSVKHEKNIEHFPHKKSLLKCKNIQGTEENFSAEFEKGNAGPAASHTEVVQHSAEMQSSGFEDTKALTNALFSRGNLRSTAKALSSPSGTTSKNSGFSAVNQSSNGGGGFCTASGKKVSVSADAVKKAERLLNEIHTHEDANQQQKGEASGTAHLANQFQAGRFENGGFQTASGKGVVLSAAALKKAKSLFSECEAVEDKTPVCGLPSSNSGFLAAGGKPVALSAAALQKAKALFSDITVGAEIPAASDTRTSDSRQNNGGNSDRIPGGFMTAGGTTVCVSQKNLLKATDALREFDDGSFSEKTKQGANTSFKDRDSVNGNNRKDEDGVAPVSGGGSEEKRLPRFKQDQRVTNISEEHGRRCGEFEHLIVGSVVNEENLMRRDDAEIHKGVFKNSKSTNGNPSFMAKPLSSPLCTTSKNSGSSAFSGFSNGVGFCTASGKRVSVSDEAMTKAKSLLNESAAFLDTNKKSGGKSENLPPQDNVNDVALSSAAPEEEKPLPSESKGVEDKIGGKSSLTKMAVSFSPPRNGGFLAASGKPVAFSSEALQKAKALFNDIGFSEVPTVSDTRKTDKHEDVESINCGFTTAGGAKVQVSQKNLMNAKNLLKDFADGGSPSDATDATHKSDLSNVKRTSKSCLTAARDEDTSAKSFQSLQETDHENETLQNSTGHGCISVKREAVAVASELKEGKIIPSREENLRDTRGEEAVNALDSGGNHTSGTEALGLKRTEESSFLMFQSLNLSGCSETQQKFFAQEALDCTKALLEDESLAGQSPTVETRPRQDTMRSNERSAEEQKGRGKRSVDDADVTGQPPLKRRLLEEFDRTVDGPRGSTLHPQKSCPNSVMKDRRAFKYRVSPHPNITRPHGGGTNYVETKLQNTTPTQRSASGDGRSAQCRVPAFVPPFLKNAKTETHKNAVVKVNVKTPSAFVPPFKKQRTIVQESSSKPQEEEEKEDKHQHVFVAPTSSNVYMPPSRNTQSSADATSDKSKEVIQKVALAHTTNDHLMNNQKAPVVCGSEDSAATASCEEDTFPRGQDMFSNLENVEMARDMQDMRIRKKKRQTIRPLPGSLYLTKTSGVPRIPLKAAVGGKTPARFTPKQLYGYGVHQHVSDVTSESAETFRFNLQHFLKLEALVDGGGVQLADGGWLVPSNDGTAGREEFYRALCDTPGVDPKLISVEWAYNHYRWIVWKQASMERSFPETMSSLCLTPEQLLLQLKYRYDVEIDHSRRPALRKIMEQDDTAAKTLVLCVCGVASRGHSPNRPSRSDAKTPQGADAKVEPPFAVVWLTDGWYAIKAQLDEALTAMLRKGRLAVGGKLIMCGAQLVGSQEACSPLEAPESLMLKICANSSRPARWDAKLGFHRDPRPFLLPVSCLYSNGGPVGCVDITILRSYPIQWMERKPDGGVVFRSVRAEEKEARRYSSHKQKAMEILFAKIQTEFEKEQKGNDKPQRRRRTISRQDIAGLQDGEELYEAVGDDPAYLEAHLTEQQLETLQTYRRSLMEKNQSELQERYRRALEAENSDGSCPQRDVAPVWRLCIADSRAQPGAVYQLNLWRPPSDLQSLLKEGCRYKVYNLTTSDGKKRSGVETVQLTGTKKTQFQDLQASQERLSARFQPRASSNFVNLQNPQFQPLCGEVDLTGFVISVIDGLGSSPAFYLADGDLNFVKVRCFSSFAQSGLEDLVKPRVLLALSNLQLRGQSLSPTPVVFAGDLTVFSTNPKEAHLQESLSQLRNLLQAQQNFFLNAEEKLSHLLKSDGLSSIISPALHPRTPAASNQRQDTKTSLISQQPIRSHGSFTPVSRNHPAATASTENDPKSLKRRRALDYLSRIPSPPTLSHLGSGTSPCVKKTFNPPRRSGTPSTLLHTTVQTPARKPVVSPMEDEWVNDEELAMIDTQTLRVG